MKINLRGLESFREIIRSGSATAAARQLGLSQPAVSRLIAQLEREIGFRLFHRVKGRLVPTPQAQLLFEEVDVAFQGIERVQALVRDVNEMNTGQLRIVAPPSFAEGPLVPIISEFMKAHPKVGVSLDSRTRPTTMNLVATRTADCGFGKLPIEHAGIRTRPLVVNGSACALASSHRLARRRVLTPVELSGENVILIGRGNEARRKVEEAFAAAGATLRVQLETHNVGAACAFAAAGMGVAIVNEMLARAYVGRGIVLRPFKPQVLHEYVFMTSASVPETPLVGAFYDTCRRLLARRGAGKRGQYPFPGKGMP
jgi:DNA-binding transcriptional LysR family regulator